MVQGHGENNGRRERFPSFCQLSALVQGHGENNPGGRNCGSWARSWCRAMARTPIVRQDGRRERLTVHRSTGADVPAGSGRSASAAAGNHSHTPYKGQQLHVQVLTDGFAYAGRVYPSLSAVAKVITGSPPTATSSSATPLTTTRRPHDC
jgi:hypothetical protein